ncbi:MAG TPA: hypothetical protein VMF55_13830 [Solirubrobacterales bacterium]|nr:hypothetical protein [Solirubrobacterales bacterium]
MAGAGSRPPLSGARRARRALGARPRAPRLLLAGGILAIALAGPSGATGAETEPVIPCQGDACAPIPTPPEDPQPGTLVTGPGNPPPHYAKPHEPKPSHRHHRPKHRHQGKGKGKNKGKGGGKGHR